MIRYANEAQVRENDREKRDWPGEGVIQDGILVPTARSEWLGPYSSTPLSAFRFPLSFSGFSLLSYRCHHVSCERDRLRDSEEKQ